MLTSTLRKGAASLLLNAFLLSRAVSGATCPVITKDVVIIGGGASGTYAAVRLREDYGASILLIEKETVLGGHTNTFDDPETGVALNYGVQTYMNYMGAVPFFERFNIPLQAVVRFTSETVYVDPFTGNVVPNVTAPPPISDSINALQRYLEVIAPWDDIMLPGYWNFPSGDDIPADLLLPWVDFVAKYNLSDAAPVLARVAGISITSPLPALYAVMNFGTPVVESYVNNSFFNPVPFNNSLVYGRSAQLLGSDVKLGTTVVQANRTDNGVSLIVKDQAGVETIVRAKRILFAAHPSLKNLEPFGVDDQETAVFSTWANKTSYAAMVKTNVIPDNTSITFTTNSTVPRPYSFNIGWLGASRYLRVLFSAKQATTADEMKAYVTGEILMMAASGDFPTVDGEAPYAEIVALSDHSGVAWDQTVEQLQAGFMQQLYALQGHQSTWYTGGLWCPDYTSNVWAYTDTVLPRLLESIA
ncbi:FAD/NAD(P)-binding domain-containing protein [Thozetella sp. PMI_491]|nr:FAD/NAD(P)-binding domain-containing protein [Thozetella sp. PMI_491]